MISPHQRLIWKFDTPLRFLCMFIAKMHQNQHLADHFNKHYTLPMYIRADEYFSLAGSVPQYFAPMWHFIDLVMYADFTVVVEVASAGAVESDV